jgi:hypothetical protein
MISNRPTCLARFAYYSDFGSSATCQHVGRLLERSATRVVSVDGNTSLTSDDNGGAVMVRDRPASTVVAFVRDS